MPPKTLDAFRDHGEVRATLTADVEQARKVLEETERLGLDLKGVTDDLVSEGVRLFAQAFDQLLGAVATKRAAMLGDKLNRQDISMPAALKSAHQDAIKRAQKEGWTRRLWAGDATLWTNADEAKWLGWLGAGSGAAIDFAALADLQKQVKAEAFTHALLIGMGGSSLGPEVFAKTFPSADGFPKLLVLDSTDPAEIARVEAEIDLARTLFIVSSKSGSTLEPNILHDYFFARAGEALGKKPGGHFIAVTDPGSPLEDVARRDGFRRVYHGDPAIGGRYSVLSNFGMVPAAIIGRDVAAFIDKTRMMVRACGADAPASANPGVTLGVLLGAAALAGRDKVTIIAADAISDFGAWLEQLLAESTGKHGKGLIPVDDEPLGTPDAYGADRIFISLELEGQPDRAGADTLGALEAAGHPTVRITMASADMLGQEFFRWEMAVAVAGAIMSLNPFDQPDVEASKVKTRALTDAYEKTGGLASETPLLKSDSMALYADSRNGEALAQLVETKTLDAYLRAHFRRAHDGDYIGILAYIDRSSSHRDLMRDMRRRIRDKMKVATVGGFGPRFLHSTGQAYKGGPNSGVFLQLTAAPARDIAIPGRKASFGVVEQAEARGDFDVLAERGRRVLRLDLGKDIEGGLKRLADVVERALS